MTIIFKKSPEDTWYATVITDSYTKNVYPGKLDYKNFKRSRKYVLDFLAISYDEKGFTKTRVLEYFEGVI